MSTVRAFVAAVGIVAGMVYTQAVLAADDTLLPLTFKSLQADLKKALIHQSIKDPLTSVGCLNGNGTKRTVCTYKVGDYATLMAATEEGGLDIVGLTAICGAENALGMAQCTLVYAATLEMTTPLPQKVRGDILGTLMQGILVGNAASISTAERKFIMQKVQGIWFHIYAVNSKDAE